MYYMNGQNIGSCHLMLQNVKLYTLVVFRMLVTTVHINETQLESLENIRDLGIQVDSKLKFHAHTNTFTKKAYHIWVLSVNLLSIQILMLLLDYIQLLYTPLLNMIQFYGDLLTYLTIEN